MAGLNSLVADTTSQTTALPNWYDTAQQNLTSQAQTAAGTVPTAAQTPVQGVANQMQTAASPFAQGQTNLNQIATGAANPWLVSDTGQVAPNPNTAMGGLFQAQNQQLNQLLPNIAAPAQAAGIGAGQFGSLRSQTAADKAITDAQSQLFSEQMKAALQNQSTGAQAASGLGTLGSNQAQSAIGLGQFQQNAPLAGLTDLANIINAQRTGSTVSKTTEYSPLSQATGLITALGGTSGSGGVLGQLFGSTTKNAAGQTINVPGILGAGGISGVFKNLFSSTPDTSVSQAVAGTYPLADGGTYVVRDDGSAYIKDASGAITNFDKSGNYNYGITGTEPPDTGGGGNLPDSTDTTDNGDYNGVDYGNGGGGVLPPTENDNLDSGDYNGVDYE
jgi:hypothetical protein